MTNDKYFCGHTSVKLMSDGNCVSLCIRFPIEWQSTQISIEKLCEITKFNFTVKKSNKLVVLIVQLDLTATE